MAAHVLSSVSSMSHMCPRPFLVFSFNARFFQKPQGGGQPPFQAPFQPPFQQPPPQHQQQQPQQPYRQPGQSPSRGAGPSQDNITVSFGAQHFCGMYHRNMRAREGADVVHPHEVVPADTRRSLTNKHVHIRSDPALFSTRPVYRSTKAVLSFKFVLPGHRSSCRSACTLD